MRLTPEQRVLLAQRCKDLPDKLPPGSFAVYTLADPLTGDIRYVGVTRYPRIRLIRHVKRLTMRSQKRAWMLRLAEDGQVPIMRIVETVTGTKQDAVQRERDWINRLFNDGAPLVNDKALPNDDLRVNGEHRAPHRMTTDQPHMTEDEVFIPIEQVTITLYGRQLVVVRLTDGRECVVLRWLCDGLNLNTDGQVRRIRHKRALAASLLSVRVETDGGPQAMPALTLDALPGWILTIDEKRIAPETRDNVIQLQREAVEVLARRFGTEHWSTFPGPTVAVPAEPPPAQPAPPAPDAPREVWRTYHQGMLAWLDWQDAVDRWQNLTEVQLYDHEDRLRDHDRQIGELHSRVEGNEELSRVLAEALTRLGPRTLSPEHQATVKRMAARLHDLSGLAYATIYGELNAAFHVGRYSDIAEARWPEIAVWFKTRIAAAEQQGHRH